MFEPSADATQQRCSTDMSVQTHRRRMLERGESILPRRGREGHCRETRVRPWLTTASRKRPRTEIAGRRKDCVQLGAVFFRTEAIQPGRWLVKKLAQEARLFNELGVPARDPAAECGTLRAAVPYEVGQGHRFKLPRARQAMFAGPIIDLKSYRRNEKSHTFGLGRSGGTRERRCPSPENCFAVEPFGPDSPSNPETNPPPRPFRYT